MQNQPQSDDPMMVTGLRMTTGTQNGSVAFQPHYGAQSELNPMETYQADGRVSIGATPSTGNSNYHHPNGLKGGSALKAKNNSAYRVNSNDRKSSIGGDSSSPFPEGGIIGNTLGLNHQ